MLFVKPLDKCPSSLSILFEHQPACTAMPAPFKEENEWNHTGDRVGIFSILASIGFD